MAKGTRIIMLREDGQLFFGGRTYDEEQLESLKKDCRDGTLRFGQDMDDSIKVDAIYPYSLSGMSGRLIKPIAKRVAK